jgi:signal transduction histidine kinase
MPRLTALPPRRSSADPPARSNAGPRIGLRQLLVALSLAGIVPLAIVATVLLVALWRAQQAELHEAARGTAHALAVSVEQRLEGTLRRLSFLATQPGLDLAGLRQRSAEVLSASPELAALAVLTREEARLPHQKELFEGEAGTRGVELAVPVVRDASVRYGLFATLDAAALSDLLRSQLREPSGVAMIADADGRVLARTRGAEHYAGKPLAAPLAAAVQARPSGVGRVPVHDGADVYSAWTPIRGTRWTLILEMPAAPADAALARSLGALAALLILVLVASSLFAWLIGRRLADAIHAAAGAAVAMSADQPAGPVVSRIDEVQTLMEALERSSARLAAAQEDRRRAAAELDAVLQQESRARTQAEAANRAKDEFLAMLGHELRNPLGAIGSAMRVIERLPSSSGDHKAAREIIARQTAHLAKIVDDLLDVGRVVSGRILLRRNLVDLAQAAAAAVATVRAADRPDEHQWILELAAVLVSADPTRIDQVLANLLGNAAKFTPSGGRIRVQVCEQDGEAWLTVEDSGPGVRAELLPHIFELFAKDAVGADRGGLGIGLALVKRLVELHGGSVNAQNIAPHGGARFTVRLPAIPEPEPVARHDPRPLPAPRPARQARVLIVEDNDDSRVSLQRILQAEGHLVSAARDARAGLEAAAAGSPNIAVVDIGLPGMDGYQFARALRERLGSGVRLIALTGYGTEADRQRAAEAGFDAHLTKPVDLDRLLALITEAAT